MQCLINLSGIESLLDSIKSDCDILQEASDTFKDFINEQKKKLKGMDSSLALKQACMNALANEEFTKEVSNKYQNKAKEYLKKPLYTPSVIKLLSNYINKGIANILHNHMFIILYNLLRLNQKITSKITHIPKI